MYPISNEVKALFESEQKQILRITGGEKSPVSKSVGPSAMASISDAYAADALDITIGIEPVQAGSGDPSPTNVRPISGWTGCNVSRTGKNLADINRFNNLNWTNDTIISNGITFKRLRNGAGQIVGISATGTVTGTAQLSIIIPTAFIPNGSILSGSIAGAQIYFENPDSPYTRYGLSSDGVPSTIDFKGETPEYAVLILRAFEGSILNGTFLPMLRPATVTDPTFEPYNPASKIYPITFPSEAGTVYGGTLDVTTGKLTVDRGYDTYNGTEDIWIRSSRYPGSFYTWRYLDTLINAPEAICSHARYNTFTNYGVGMFGWDGSLSLFLTEDPNATVDDFKKYLAAQYANGTPVQICYELATPITYQLTPMQIALLEGVNNVWADCGDVTVEYATGYEYEINITDADVVIDSFSIDRFSCIGNKLEVGTATSAQMTVKLDNYDGRFNGIVFEGTELFVEIGIADWTQDNPTVNWIPCGYFTPDEQPRSLNIITIHALDRMMQFDATMPTLTPWVTQSGDVMTDSQGNIIYFVSNVQFPVTVQNLVKRVALLCGVPFTQSLSNFPNYNYTLSALPTLQQEITFRNIIQWCAGIMGANAWIDWTGSLRFSWYGATTGYTSTTANRFSSDLHEDDITITGVQYTNTQNVTIVSGSADYAIDMTGNYLAAVGISTILPNVKNVINGFTYRPFTASVINAPYLWPMDMITFVKDGVNHTCAVTNVNFGINGTTALEGKGETAQTNSGTAPSGVTKEQGFLIEQAAEVTRKIDASMNQEGIFNLLTNNGEVQGLFLYNGKIYLNAEYIQTGTLAANLLMAGILTVGGANDGNGQIRILDGNGNVIGLWNKNGIQISSGNINLNYNSTLSIAFDSNSTKKAVFNNSGFKLTLNSGATIATGSIIYTSSNYYPNVDMGSLMCGYTSENDGSWRTTLAPGYLSMSHDANYVTDRSFIYNQQSLSVFVYAEGTTRSFNVDLENNSMTFSGGFTLRENLTVLGAKSRAVSTDQYSERLLYCYETPSPMFGDVGEGIIGEDGKCYIWLDPVFAQTITTTQYQVFLQRYGSGECWVAERKGSYFVVEGTPGMAFGWELKAKQRDFDQRRLERNDEPFTVPTQTYGEDAAKYIDELRKERLSA